MIFADTQTSSTDADASANRIGGVAVISMLTDTLDEPGTEQGDLHRLGRARMPTPSSRRSPGKLNVWSSARNSWTRVAPFVDSELMRGALLAGLLTVVTTSLVGTWVVLRGMKSGRCPCARCPAG